MSNTITKLAGTIADQVIAGGAHLKVKADSLLEPIVGEICRPMESAEVTSTESLIKHTNEYFRSTSPNPFATSMEETELLGNPVEMGLQGLVADIKPVAVGIISRVKDKVIPAVNEIFEKAYGSTQREVDRGGVMVEIKTDGSEKAIWQHPALIEMVNASAQTGDLEEARLRTVVFPELDHETLLSNLHSVNTTLNIQLDELLAEADKNCLVHTYNDIFNTGGERGELVPNQTSYLLGMLLAIGFKENVPDGVQGVGEASHYRLALDKVVDGCAAYIKRQCDAVNNFAKSGRLVLSYPAPGAEFRKGSEIIVNGLLYEAWLEAGGSVDAILGGYVSKDQPRNADLIMENQERLRREWVRHIGLAQSSLRDNFERVFLNALRREIHSYGKETGLTVETKAIEHMYERSSSIDPDNAYAFARRIVVKALFGEGDYLSILENIDNISNRVKGIELADAIELAIIDWLVDWALNMVVVSRR